MSKIGNGDGVLNPSGGFEDGLVVAVSEPSSDMKRAAGAKRRVAIILFLVLLCGSAKMLWEIASNSGKFDGDMPPIISVDDIGLPETLQSVSDLTLADEYIQQMSFSELSFEEICAICEFAEKEGDLESCNLGVYVLSHMIASAQIAEALEVRPAQILSTSFTVPDNLVIGVRSVEVSYYESFDDVDNTSTDKAITASFTFDGMMDELAKVIQESHAGRLVFKTDSKSNAMTVSEAMSILRQCLLSKPAVLKGSFGKLVMNSTYDPERGQAFFDYASSLVGKILGASRARSNGLRKFLSYKNRG